jgi:hypothetical protein
MAIPQIIDVSPAPNAQGIPIGDQLRITFDQEMDLTSLNAGTIVLSGPDEAPLFGPADVTPLDDPGFDDEDILSSPYFKGYVKGTFTYSKVDASGGIVDDSTEDTTGDGTLWRTVAIFTPDKPLKPNVEYTAILLGDEASDDDYDTGVKTRTVFDTVFAGSGDGSITFDGGYTGEVESSYTIEITVGGSTGTAQYIWWEDNDPLTTYQGITTTGERELENGIFITCGPDGTFTIGDTFTVVIKPAVVLPNNYRWAFTTGSGSILTPPSTSSTSGIENVLTNIAGDSITSVSTFSVSSTVPEDAEYGLPLDTVSIVVVFSAAVDEDTLTGAITLKSETANGDDVMFQATGDLEYSSVLTSAILTITLDADQLYNNNIVILTLDSTVADTEGKKLASHYTTYFTTPYTPLYSSLRRIRLDLGPLITDVPDETIMLAILEASIQTTAMSFSTTIASVEFFNFAKREYTTCLAELTLVKALLGDTGLSDKISKKLGDLNISRGGLVGLRDTLIGLENCVATWEVSVQTGGAVTPNTSVKPETSVKGTWSQDGIVVNRQWEPTTGIGTTNAQSSANTDVYASGRRDLRTYRNRTSFRKNRDYE